MNPDPLRPPETDAEPEPPTRPVLVALLAGLYAALYRRFRDARTH